jgi:hypothetical protein
MEATQIVDLTVFQPLAVIRHPDFHKQGLFENDVAIVELEEEVKLTDSVIPICLWGANYDFSMIQDTVGTVSIFFASFPISITPPKS